MSSYSGTADRPDQAKAIAAVDCSSRGARCNHPDGPQRAVRQPGRRTADHDQYRGTAASAAGAPAETRAKTAAGEKAGGRTRSKSRTVTSSLRRQAGSPSPIPAAKVAGAGTASSSAPARLGRARAPAAAATDLAAAVMAISRASLRRVSSAISVAAITVSSPAVACLLERRWSRCSFSPADCRAIAESCARAAILYVDSGLCPLIVERLRFRPALDDHGHPVPYQLQYVATWRL